MLLEKVEVFHGRVEQGGILPGEGEYPLVTARAVAPLAKMVSLCAPLLARGGLLAAFHGEKVYAALKMAGEEIEGHRLRVERVIPYTLPKKKTQRHILLLGRKKGHF